MRVHAGMPVETPVEPWMQYRWRTHVIGAVDNVVELGWIFADDIRQRHPRELAAKFWCQQGAQIGAHSWRFNTNAAIRATGCKKHPRSPTPDRSMPAGLCRVLVVLRLRAGIAHSLTKADAHERVLAQASRRRHNS